jgi:hypothetical protein
LLAHEPLPLVFVFSPIFFLTACASAPPQEPAASVDAELSSRSCTVSTTIATTIHASPADVYDYVVREDTPARDLHRFLVVPGVRGDRLLGAGGGGWDHAGAERVVYLDDGETCIEELDLLDRPSRFAYHSHDYALPLGRVIAEARGAWTFEPAASPDAPATLVTWTYTFVPQTCAVRPELRLFADALFRPYMERAMTSIARHIETR